MLIKAKILSVEMRNHKDKPVADVAYMTSNPTEAHVVTLWNNSVAKDEHKPYASLVGQDVEMAVRPEVFNGKLQLNIFTAVLPQPVRSPVSIDKKAG